MSGCQVVIFSSSIVSASCNICLNILTGFYLQGPKSSTNLPEVLLQEIFQDMEKKAQGSKISIAPLRVANAEGIFPAVRSSA